MRCAVALLAAAGCYSFPTMARTRIQRPGHVELWAAPEGYLVVAPSTGAHEFGITPRGVVEGGVRYGATDHLELDARVGTFGLELGPRIQLLRAPTPDAGFDIALAPAVEFTFPDKPALELPLQVGWNFTGGHQLIASARLVYQDHVGVGGVTGPVSFMYAGASIGFAYRVTHCVSILPELAMLTQIYAEPGFSSSLGDAVGVQLGLGVLWDH